VAEYVNTTNHAQQVGSGAFIAPYGKGQADPKDEHDKALIEDGALIPAKPQRKNEES
jgi:hypothetical protein